MTKGLLGLSILLGCMCCVSCTSSSATQNKIDNSIDTNKIAGIITFEGKQIHGQGKGFLLSDSMLYITSPGTYVISGELDNGSIVVNSPSSEKVSLVLDGFEGNCEEEPVFIIEQSSQTELYLKEDTINSIRVSKEKDSSNTNAIFSASDLEICGKGSLKIQTEAKDAIEVLGQLDMSQANITIQQIKD